MVYTAAPELEYAAIHVVDGYRKGGKAKKKSILVRRPNVVPGDEFPEETNPCYQVDARPGDSWEVAFYLSLFTADGVLAVGNGSFTYIGGLHAIGAQLPVLALGGFGGVADEILKLLSRRLSDSDYRLMAQTKKDAAWAKSYVASLTRQREQTEQLVESAKGERELRRCTLAAALSAFGVLILLIVVAQSFRADDTLDWFRAYVTALLPAIAGAIGAVQRIVFGFYRGEDLALVPAILLVSVSARLFRRRLCRRALFACSDNIETRDGLNTGFAGSLGEYLRVCRRAKLGESIRQTDGNRSFVVSAWPFSTVQTLTATGWPVTDRH
jgi:hypothetical protein